MSAMTNGGRTLASSALTSFGTKRAELEGRRDAGQGGASPRDRRALARRMAVGLASLLSLLGLATLLVAVLASNGGTTSAGPAAIRLLSAQLGWTPADTQASRNHRKRDQAVLRAVSWMRSYLETDAHLDALGTDAVLIFRELASSRNPQIRSQADAVAERLIKRLRAGMLAGWTSEPANNADLSTALDLLGLEKKPLAPDAMRLLRLAERDFARLPTAAALHGVSDKRLAAANEDELYDLLMESYVIEKAMARFPRSFPGRSGLGKVLRFIARRRFVSYVDDGDGELFFDHAYLMTHFAFVVSDYGSVQLSEVELPSVGPYLRANFEAVLQEADIELVGEFVDALRSFGHTEDDDGIVDRGTRFLLSQQSQDGSWGPWQSEEDPYDAIHYTWCAVGGLKDRGDRPASAFTQRTRAMLVKTRRK